MRPPRGHGGGGRFGRGGGKFGGGGRFSGGSRGGHDGGMFAMRGHPRRSSVGALATRPRPIYVLPSLVKLPVSWLRRAWEPRQGETHIADGCSATQRPGAY
jgi:hypothetical protein